ncbi:MAG: radical SAM protein [Deltaproteobacteria bacterium]|nr:radical SAM protein [Deltaproteobacteria bacterium]MCL5277731.1 radical SAM protein [Deltaproteobacteria bacterium]
MSRILPTNENGDLDCLLIHTPKFNHYVHPFNKVQFVNLMPMGLLFMADLLKRHGFKSRVLHLGIEKLFTKDFSLREYLLLTKPKVVGITLHWHHQSFDAIEVAREVKKVLPDTFLVLGGLTASFFKNEILESFGFIDGVISGDGEGPLLKIVEHIVKNNGDITLIPNLARRSDGSIVQNTCSYITTKEVLDSASFSNYDLMENYDFYPQLFFFNFNTSPALNKIVYKSSLVASMYLPIGKGCTANCSFCGGGYDANGIINGKVRIVLRSPDKIIENIKDGIRWGFKSFNTDFDLPGQNSRTFFLELFKTIRNNNLKITYNFNSYSLPSVDFVDEFSATFSRDSQIIISPESGSEKLRKIHKGYFYTNAELLQTLKYMEGKGVNAGVYFAGGLPLETEEDVKETIALQKHLRRYKNIKQLITVPLELDPASPMFLCPDKFNIILTRKTFLDYYKGHARLWFDRGYYLSGSSEKEMMKTQCKNYCFLNPVFGKYLCYVSHTATKFEPNFSIRYVDTFLSFILRKLFK